MRAVRKTKTMSGPGGPRGPARLGPQQQLAGDVTAFKTAVHLGRLGQGKDALDGHLQPAGGDAAQHMIDAILPFGQGMVDMAEMQTRKRL